MTTKNASLTFVVLVVIVVVIAFSLRGCNNQAGSVQAVQAILATQTTESTQITPEELPSTGWTFSGFVDAKSSWGIFVNTNGARVKAMCSAPNSPAPDVGADYIWDKNTNILYPVVDNSKGNIQRFWYPTVMQ